MAEQYTPTTGEVRAAWQENFTYPSVGELGEQFDRFLAQVRAEALREAADDFDTYVDFGGPVGAGMTADKWLRRRADRIADTNQQDRST